MFSTLFFKIALSFSSKCQFMLFTILCNSIYPLIQADTIFGEQAISCTALKADVPAYFNTSIPTKYFCLHHLSGNGD